MSAGIKDYLSLVKFSHTVFALPFALTGFFYASIADEYGFSWILLVEVLLCMVFARSAAMAFNRYLDSDIDTANPRTAEVREIPRGVIQRKQALIFVIVNSALFILTTYFINALVFFLSPIALLVILGYSYTKRFTALCHVILGLGLSLSPIGSYLAVTGQFDLVPILLSLAVLFWVSGFDIIYSMQDREFDREMGLFSIPVALGGKNALRLSNLLHLASAVCIIWVGMRGDFGWFYFAGALIFLALLLYQHTLVSEDDLSKINIAFFTTNGIASIVFGVLAIVDMFLYA